MLTNFGALIVGLVVLVWSADKFVLGAASIATRLGMSRLLVGMVIVGFGTSAPEMTVSALAAFQGSPGIALGNVFGSNIANIGLILGLTVLLKPILIEDKVVHREIPMLLGISAIAVALVWDLHISRFDAFILLFIFGIIMFLSIKDSMREKKMLTDVQPLLPPDSELIQKEEPEEEVLEMKMAAFWLIVGLILLISSSRLLVWAAIEIATAFGVSEIIIGLTIVAVGTSLPELAASIAATKRNEHSMVIGNIVGSNLFNTLFCVGIAGIVSPMTVEADVLNRDIFISLAFTGLLYIFCIKVGRQKQGKLSRYEGFVLLMAYILYTSYLLSIALNQPNIMTETTTVLNLPVNM